MSELKHYGTPRRSGRYPWGSGDDPQQRDRSLRGHIKELKAKGMSEKEIADGLGISTTQLRAEVSLEKSEQRKADAAQALRLKDKGYSNVAIGERMGINESSVRNLLDPVMQERALITERTADMLRAQIDNKRYLDVGAGAENQIGVSKYKLDTAIAELQKEGYKISYVNVTQVGTGKPTTIKVLTKDDVDYKDIYANQDKIQTIADWTRDGGRTWESLKNPVPISSDRISIRYREDGGEAKDGVIELRRGKSDLSLGEASYAQVRIGVDGTHFLKGMAIYSDDMPDGVDVIFNTNKSQDVGKMGAMKPIKDDPDNPFGSIFRQKTYIDADGTEKLSPINIVNEEGDWTTWSKTLSSQMLSKQRPSLAKQQLDLALKQKQEEFDEILALTNPTVRQKMLQTFADECDSAAVDLKAAALPRQGNYVILPSNDIKASEIYAPNYVNGERVVLIRHPHGGTFEIPQLTVNNNDAGMKSIFGNAMDAVVIHPSVAKKLSGADFDGDTVLVIPNGKGQVKTSPSIKGLADFDPKLAYPEYPGMKRLSETSKQTEMGKISNLITDMTIKGASQDEIARAVRHSMVIIDAEKHGLNYKQSYIDNNISDLKEIYQGGSRKGASTIISRASSEIRVDKRASEYSIDPKTGKKIFKTTPESYVDPKTGKLVVKKTKSTKMYEADDARKLSSGTRMEDIYAEYANGMKNMGDKARLQFVNTPRLEYSPSAKKTYATQVESLKAKLSIAIGNKPRERQAQLLANHVIRTKQTQNPDMTKDQLKKVKTRALAEARYRKYAKKTAIDISPKEWEAIQAGAISHNFLMQILNNTPLDQVKQYATPRTSSTFSPTKLNKARAMLSRGYTQAEVAASLGVSASGLLDALNEN